MRNLKDTDVIMKTFSGYCFGAEPECYSFYSNKGSQCILDVVEVIISIADAPILVIDGPNNEFSITMERGNDILLETL
jgi:hypothetical protein